MGATINKVLIVDDNRLPRIMGRTILSEHFPEVEVFEAELGEEALEIARSNHIDLALVDINMPGMNGLELTEHLRSESLVPHICFISANIQQYIREKAEELSAQFIAKPVTEEKLLSYIRSIQGAGE